MDTVNQLLAKAMSTTSEQEAVSCLMMARRKSNSLPSLVSAEYNGQNAEYWYRKAETLYLKLKEETSRPRPQNTSSADYVLENIKLRREIIELKTANITLETEKNQLIQRVKKAEGQKTTSMFKVAFWTSLIMVWFMLVFLS
jgi:hypothetical protein